MSAPHFLLLDLGPAGWEFINTLNGIEGISTMCNCGLCVPTEIVAGLIEYIVDRDTAYGCLLEFVREMQEQYHQDLEDREDREAFGDAIRAIGMAIFEELKRIGAYDNEGALWYCFNRFVDVEVLLERLTPKEMDTLRPLIKHHKP